MLSIKLSSLSKVPLLFVIKNNCHIIIIIIIIIAIKKDRKSRLFTKGGNACIV